MERFWAYLRPSSCLIEIWSNGSLPALNFQFTSLGEAEYQIDSAQVYTMELCLRTWLLVSKNGEKVNIVILPNVKKMLINERKCIVTKSIFTSESTTVSKVKEIISATSKNIKCETKKHSPAYTSFQTPVTTSYFMDIA